MTIHTPHTQAVLVNIGLVRLPAWVLTERTALSLRQLSFGANRRLERLPPEISLLQRLLLLSCSACGLEGAVSSALVALTQLEVRVRMLPRTLRMIPRTLRMLPHALLMLPVEGAMPPALVATGA
jgi:hypothetical protein